MNELRMKGFNIIYVDEVIFGKNTNPTHCWSLKNRPLYFDYTNVDPQCYAVIAATSYFRGVELIKIFKDSVNIHKFLEFLEDLRNLHFADDIAIFMDRLAVHRSNMV